MRDVVAPFDRARPGSFRTSRLVLAAAFPLLLSLAACSLRVPDLPTTAEKGPEPVSTLVWTGTGAAYERTRDGWKRTPENDYEFTVVQRRWADRWESVKTMLRRHPAYGGRPGPRTQALMFRVDIGAPRGEEVPLRVTSNLGDGEGTTDRAFRSTKIELAAKGVSRFFPFDRYRLSQEIRLEEGRLVERVELLKRAKDGTDGPFAKIEEEGRLFLPAAAAPPG